MPHERVDTDTDRLLCASLAVFLSSRYVLLLHAMLGECDGGRGRWGYPVGGMGAVSEAIAASAKALGVDIFTDQVTTDSLITSEK